MQGCKSTLSGPGLAWQFFFCKFTPALYSRLYLHGGLRPKTNLPAKKRISELMRRHLTGFNQLIRFPTMSPGLQDIF
jgi:hypothetical protein